jgi:hypothetical protein
VGLESCIAPDLSLVHIVQNVLSSLLVIYIVKLPSSSTSVGGIYHIDFKHSPSVEQAEKNPRFVELWHVQQATNK